METFVYRSGVMCVLVAMAAASASDVPVTIIQHGAVDMKPMTGDADSSEGERSVHGPLSSQAEQFTSSMRERLADPEQRRALRVEQRAQILRSHAQVGAVLGLDETTEHRLIELLTDQQMYQLELMYGQSGARFDLQRQANAKTHYLEQMSELLGEEGLERYEKYAASLAERQQVESLCTRLSAGNELQPDQKERLIELLHERSRRWMEALQGARWTLRSDGSGAMPPPEHTQRASQLSMIAENEESWRLREASNRELQAHAAAFLSPVQLKEFSRWQAEEQSRLQRRVESLRVQAGLDPKIPEHATPMAPASEPGLATDKQVRIEIRLTVNGAEPTLVTKIVRSGEPFTFETAEGLTVEATPKLYDDHWLDLQMTYYEQGSAGKRRLPGGDTFGIHTLQPDGRIGAGGGGTLTAGRKAYAIKAMISAMEI
jgi:hypothetical protein